MAFLYILFGLLISLVILTVYARRAKPCPDWLSRLIERDNPFTKAQHAKTIVSSLKLQPGMKVLDAGCGPGRVTIPLAKAVGTSGSVDALDVQDKMLSIVAEKAKRANLSNISTIKAKLGDSQLRTNHYDRMVLVTVLGEIPNQEEAMAELYRALKPGGLLALIESIFDPHYQRLKSVESIAKEAGFKQIKVIGNKLAYLALFEKPSV